MEDQTEFTLCTRENKTALVHPDFADVVADALFEGLGCQDAELKGRGTLQRFQYPGGNALVRTYRRGGAVRLLTTDRYFFDNRPMRELEIHIRVHAQGLAVPAPLGACWERRGPTYKGCIATDELAGENLLADLSRKDGNRRDTLIQLGALLLRMHDMGVYHADLQIRNVLVVDGQPFLIDFDNARMSRSLSHTQRTRNLLRLRRSFEKNGFGAEEFDAVCEGYGVGKISGWLSKAYRVKGILSDISRSTGSERDV